MTHQPIAAPQVYVCSDGFDGSGVFCGAVGISETVGWGDESIKHDLPFAKKIEFYSEFGGIPRLKRKVTEGCMQRLLVGKLACKAVGEPPTFVDAAGLPFAEVCVELNFSTYMDK